MKYKVLKTITRRSENMKVYEAGKSIELDKKEGDSLEAQGFVKKAPAKKKD